VDTAPERNDDQLLTPAEAAKLRRVSPRSLRRWNALGLLEAERTPGGHRRYRLSEVRSLSEQTTEAVA
jgi:excisionase family DNA binding protein